MNDQSFGTIALHRATEKQIAEAKGLDRQRMTLLADAKVCIEIGGPNSGSWASNHGVGVWNGKMYETCSVLNLRQALDIALSEDLQEVRRINREGCHLSFMDQLEDEL